MKRFWLVMAALVVLGAVGAGYVGMSRMATAGSIPEATRVSFRWVYQPSGTQNLTSGISSGTATLGTLQGYAFGTQAVVSNSVADVYYADPSCECSGVGLWSNNGLGGVHDLGTIAFGSVTSAPNKSLGVGTGQYYNSQEVEAVVGHTYVLVTRDGQDYAKLIIDSIVLVSQTYPKGDVNCTDSVNSVDSLLILRHSAGLSVALPPDCPLLGQ